MSKALRLAALLDAAQLKGEHPASAELRRLHAFNAELVEALKLAYRNLNGGPDKLTPNEHGRAWALARRALAKAEKNT